MMETDLETPKPSVLLKLNSDYELILKEMERHNMMSFIPDEFQCFLEDIRRVQGTPLNNLVGGMTGCGAGLFLFAMGGILAREFTSLTFIERFALASSPLLLSGLARIFVAAAEADYGYGKEAINVLLGTSVLGVGGIIALLSTVDNLSDITVNDRNYWFFLLCNILSGKGVSVYSAGMTLAAKAAPGDSPEEYKAHLKQMKDDLNLDVHPGFLSDMLCPILRKGPTEYMAMVAGVSNLAPGLTLILSSALLMPALGLRNTYIVFAAITTLGALCTHLLTTNDVYDQLRRINPKLTTDEAKRVAAWMGQQVFSPDNTFIDSFRQMSPQERVQIGLASLNYITTFGLLTAITTTGSLTLTSRGMSPMDATLTIAGVSLISSAFRGLLSFYSCSMNPETIANVSLVTMMLSSLVFSISKEPLIWTPMMYLFAVANGAGIFAVISQIAQKMPHKIGLAMGVSSGMAAFSAFPISIAFASMASCNRVTAVTEDGIEKSDTALEYLIATALCVTSLVANNVPQIKKTCSRYSMFARQNETEVAVVDSDKHSGLEIVEYSRL